MAIISFLVIVFYPLIPLKKLVFYLSHLKHAHQLKINYLHHKTFFRCFRLEYFSVIIYPSLFAALLQVFCFNKINHFSQYRQDKAMLSFRF